MLKKIWILIIPFIFLSQNIYAEVEEKNFKGEVIEILNETIDVIEMTGENVKSQVVLVRLNSGDSIELKNNRTELQKGDDVFVKYQKDEFGESYTLEGIDRSLTLFLLISMFILVVVWFGKKQGIRSLISLTSSLLIIFLVLIPLLLKGYSPVLVGLPIASLILLVAIYFTHGFNRESSVAVVGTTITILFMGLISYVAIEMGSLTGNFTEETIYLDVATNGILNLKGLLFIGVIIGILGILDDIAITQVSVVNEFKRLKEKISHREMWDKAMNIGRHHVGALINTLALAYAGVSLPILMLLLNTDSSFIFRINQEFFATEILRAIIGSLGIIMTVPVTTFLAIKFLKGKKND